ncbi:hypothetical protein [Sphingosinicella rhizophila]|uniref:Uncharacterized protein n=1 Tax=Sphingosinicella rhizophila TaxID=3050082 RepID=A0ABU3Q565_9SPHN|nr:hypothetical protein [Sphingosinicella sp. GR2756]MDT9598554.1 hypothetical protein [Sphingosinicella sp. GR2756]
MANEGDALPILSDWRQGDFTLDADLEIPVLARDKKRSLFAGATGEGMILVSQSCDILRGEGDRPFVQVSPLLSVSESDLNAISRRRKPQFATFPALEARGLVVDLDIVASAEKIVVASWTRHDGCADDYERQDFAAALARHKQRFAFSDDFNREIQPLRKWIQKRAKQSGVNGEMIRAIEHVRVKCPDWAAASLDLEFICVLNREPTITERRTWRSVQAEMETTITKAYPNSFLHLATPGELSLEDYRASVQLDLDGLSAA